MTCGDRYIRLMCRVAELVKLLYEDRAEFERQLKAIFGDRVEKAEGGYWVHGQIKAYVTQRADPYANLTLLGFAVYGAYWPTLPDAEDAFRDIRSWHRERIKRAKGARA